MSDQSVLPARRLDTDTVLAALRSPPIVTREVLAGLRHGVDVDIVGMNDSSAATHGRLSGTLGGHERAAGRLQRRSMT